ncbi:MAG: PH domain-containing protein [Gemmatimonadales bacterium]|nr:PH domain-containing protein [Gemmatimonadales bacterium]
MGYLDEHLLPGERIVYRARLHPLLFGAPIVILVLGAVAAGALQYFVQDYWYVGAAIAAMGLILLIGPAVRYATTEFAVTDKRVLAKVGLLRRRSLETLLSKVEAVEVHQDLTGRMLGYGTVTVIGTGGTRETFPMISAPLELRRQVQTQIVAGDNRRPAAPPAGRDVFATTSAPGVRGDRVERDCPWCAEPILVKARVCKHCGRPVTPV